MHRFLKTHLGSSSIIACLYSLLFSSLTLWDNTAREYNGENVVFYFLINISMTLLLTWPLFFCLSFSPVASWLIIPFLFFTGGIASYFAASLQVAINETVLPVLLETTPTEASAFISSTLILWLLFSVAVSLPCIYGLKHCNSDEKDKKILLIAAILTMGLLVSGNDYSLHVMPYNYLYATASYGINRYHLSADSKYDVAAPKATLSNQANQNLVVALVIGESARGDHFSLNGYGRETSPLLKSTPNLVNFPQVSSCEVLTRYSVPCMLTRATSKDPSFSAKETSFIGIFKKLGFRTVWINGQAGSTNFILDKGITDISFKTDIYLAGDSIKHDGDALPIAQHILHDTPGKLLLIIHSRGSHWRYRERYPASFLKWTPICGEIAAEARTLNEPKACNRQALINDYDNSLLYTDFFLHSLITMLNARNALFLYSSDHGESLGEQGHYLHGQYADRHIKEQRSIPMIWWASEYYRLHNKAQYATLMANTRQAVSHDNIFHSLLDCSGIQTEVVDKRLSLCAKIP